MTPAQIKLLRHLADCGPFNEWEKPPPEEVTELQNLGYVFYLPGQDGRGRRMWFLSITTEGRAVLAHMAPTRGLLQVPAATRKRGRAAPGAYVPKGSL